ncbi:MAG TPA: PilZ domain-containing protein [Devosia sp.]|nr:PilZ domain-containing protein [Devosia sp.]
MLKENAIAKLRADAAINPIEGPRFQRVKISVLGRYMLCDKREFPCHVTEMSPGDAVIIAPVSGEAGERVIAYVDHIGRIEGLISEVVEGGFEVSLQASPRKRDKMAAQLTWLTNKDELDLPEDRRHDRLVPDNRHSQIVLEDGRKYDCKIVDISLSGAAIDLEVRPAIGTPISLGRMRARVVRHFPYGVGVEFTSTQKMLSIVQQNLRVN